MQPAYAHIGTIYGNLKMDDKAKANYDEAFKHLDRMTEREKYRTYGVRTDVSEDGHLRAKVPGLMPS